MKAWDILVASAADSQRRRLDARAKTLKPLKHEPRIVVVFGGSGRLGVMAEEIGRRFRHGRMPIGAPIETLDIISVVTMGPHPPRLIVIAPQRLARPLIAAVAERYPHWPAPIDLFDGVQSKDREALLRHVLRRMKP